jgi:protein-tyrosine-phosphatase
MRAVDATPLMRIRLEAATAQLSEEFRGIFSKETVARYVEDSYELLGERPTAAPNFSPLIVDRFARKRLMAVAQVKGIVTKTYPEALFVCEHNSGRSQMAAALTYNLSNAWVRVSSAGSHPDEQVLPEVIRAMAEVGIDVTHEFPKPLTDEVVRAADVVVTMGCGDACPVYQGKHYEDWEIADPRGQHLSAVCAIREEIRTRCEKLVAEVSLGFPPSNA